MVRLPALGTLGTLGTDLERPQPLGFRPYLISVPSVPSNKDIKKGKERKGVDRAQSYKVRALSHGTAKKAVLGLEFPGVRLFQVTWNSTRNTPKIGQNAPRGQLFFRASAGARAWRLA